MIVAKVGPDDGTFGASFIALGPDRSIYLAGEFEEDRLPVPLQFPLKNADMSGSASEPTRHDRHPPRALIARKTVRGCRR